MESRMFRNLGWSALVVSVVCSGCQGWPTRKVPPEPSYLKKEEKRQLPAEVGFGSGPNTPSMPAGLDFSGVGSGPTGGGMMLPGSPAAGAGPGSFAR